MMNSMGQWIAIKSKPPVEAGDKSVPAPTASRSNEGIYIFLSFSNNIIYWTRTYLDLPQILNSEFKFPYFKFQNSISEFQVPNFKFWISKHICCLLHEILKHILNHKMTSMKAQFLPLFNVSLSQIQLNSTSTQYQLNFHSISSQRHFNLRFKSTSASTQPQP